MGTALQKSLGLHGLLLILLWLLVPGPNPGPASSPDALVIRPVELARPEPPPRLEMPNPIRPEPRPAARATRTEDKPRPQPEKPKKKLPGLALGGPAYPVHHSKMEAATPGAGQAPGAVAPGTNPAAGQQGDQAYPIFHPPVEIFHQGTLAANYLEVEFRLQANGSFRVRLLNSLGNAQWDAIALATLERWRWQPKRVDGGPVASTEVIRLTTQSP